MTGTVLIIEDEKEIADIIALYLKKDGMDSVHTTTAEDGLALLTNNDFDLILLDINLPKMDGFEALQNIRKICKTPIIMVSARQEDVDMLLAFGGGADDYVTKPFSPSILIARVRAHIRRNKERLEQTHDFIEFGEFTLNRSNERLFTKEKIIKVSPRELDILIFLTYHPEKPFSIEEIYKNVWGNNYGDLSTISVHIQRLRKKIEKNPTDPQFIKTRYGFGYYFSMGEK